MNEIDMIDKKINILKEQSLEYQRKLMIIRDSQIPAKPSEITQLQKRLISAQSSISSFIRQKRSLLEQTKTH